MKKLRVLCPQEYEGMDMRAASCDRCSSGWDKSKGRCTVYVGVEHLPVLHDSSPSSRRGTKGAVPDCPIADRCQHQLQELPGLCAVRARGLVCESALVAGGMAPDAAVDHPDSFNANTIAGPDEV
jgi:hypothetical protein